MLSKETSYSQARANLASILDEVVDQQQIFVVKRRNGKNVALIAIATFDNKYLLLVYYFV